MSEERDILKERGSQGTLLDYYIDDIRKARASYKDPESEPYKELDGLLLFAESLRDDLAPTSDTTGQSLGFLFFKGGEREELKREFLTTLAVKPGIDDFEKMDPRISGLRMRHKEYLEHKARTGKAPQQQ